MSAAVPRRRPGRPAKAAAKAAAAAAHAPWWSQRSRLWLWALPSLFFGASEATSRLLTGDMRRIGRPCRPRRQTRHSRRAMFPHRHQRRSRSSQSQRPPVPLTTCTHCSTCPRSTNSNPVHLRISFNFLSVPTKPVECDHVFGFDLGVQCWHRNHHHAMHGQRCTPLHFSCHF